MTVPHEAAGAPKGLRAHIVLAGRRNAGKSALFNALAGQPASIVSHTAGTTTDAVEKTLEIAPLGPVVLMDTAGVDDEGALGRQRVEGTLAALRRADAALLVTDRDQWGEPEQWLAEQLEELELPYAVVRNKADLGGFPDAVDVQRREPPAAAAAPCLDVSARSGLGLDEVVGVLSRLLPQAALHQPPLLADLVPPGGLVVLVVPLDTGAPKGRLILPQVQAIRDCLDARALCLVTGVEDYAGALARLGQPPELVVCDSQVVRETVAATPADIPLTTFSILMARLKGDLCAFAAGAAALAGLAPGDCVAIREGCSHHPQADDIGRVKLPRLLAGLAGGPLRVSVEAGKRDTPYPAACKAIIHCGACVLTRRQMLRRLEDARAAGLPMTNYGLAISLAQGVLERVLAPFPDALAAYHAARVGGAETG